MVLDEEKVRAGHTGDGVRYMLIAGTGLAALLLIALMAVFAN
ncbi:MAG: hypothetical protein AB7O04_07490 [Hyphomonadaceae bacterium]